MVESASQSSRSEGLGRRRGAVLVVAIVLAVAACTAEAGPEDGESSQPFDCAGAIDHLAEPPADWNVAADVIALPADDVLTRGRFDDGLGRWFTKFGLIVRAERAFVLRVAAADRANAVMGWGAGSDPPVPSLTFDGCPSETGEPWIVWAGGVWTEEPACTTLEVVADGVSIEARLPVGIACP
ncbi:MAG: hypothetical protein AAF547_01065 [Actinomycetota bacterium]